ncbi:hypothetical protein [Burkholderia gladioli]|uniref:hypothetical protein n=1 Tax=Burkholderia gladioli TaxID=28095 RepID=UPI0016413B54|nr:hypothetical protein [Burkholderia gladioli]
MTDHEKSPAQGGEMPPVERATITGSGGIDTVREATLAGNAAQKRNITAALTDDEREKLIDLVDRLIRNPDAITAKDCIIGNDVRTVQWIAEHTRALLTSPRAGLPRHVLASLECTAVWLEKGNDPQDAARELRACLAKIDAAPAAPAAPVADPLRRRVERLLVELHAEGRLSEGQCAKMLDISRVDWRELAEFLAPAAQAVAADGARAKDVVTREQVMEWALKANIETGWFTEQLIAALGDFAILAHAVASPATASGLPAWFDTFLTNVCEIPDRNSPVGEPDVIIATLDELKDCALNAIEKCAPVPATADEHAAFTWPPLPAFPESFAHVAGHAYFTEHQMQGYANAYGEAIRTAQAATPHSARVAALEAENRELAEFVIAVGGFWGESRSKLVGPLSLAEVIKQAMREQVSAPSDHSLREPKFAVSRDEVREHSTMRTLTAKRNTYHGGEMWKPPRGNLPSFLLDQLHGRDDPKVTAANNRSYAAGVRDGRVLGAAAVGGTDHVQRELRNDVLFGNHDALDAGANALDRLGADSEAAGVRAVAHELRKVEARAVRHSDGIELPDGEGSEI